MSVRVTDDVRVTDNVRAPRLRTEKNTSGAFFPTNAENFPPSPNRGAGPTFFRDRGSAPTTKTAPPPG
jgi:hypothetical protein